MRELCALVLVCLAGSPVAFSGEPLESNQSGPKLFPLEIRSETTLAGVTLEVSKLEDVIQELGKPDRTKIHYSRGKHPIPVGGRYEWQTNSWRLRIEAGTIGGPFTVTQVDVWGTDPEGEIGRTGRGLKLGDTIDDVRRIYRLFPYLERGPQKVKDPHPPPYWILQIQFDGSGRIDHLTLRTGAEY